MFCNPHVTTQVVHTLDVPQPPESIDNTEKSSLLYFEIPKVYDVVENIRCSANGSKISLVGAGSDLIPVENLRIILINVRYISMVLRIEVPVHEKNSVSLFYSGLHYTDDKKALIRRNNHVASYLS